MDQIFSGTAPARLRAACGAERVCLGPDSLFGELGRAAWPCEVEAEETALARASATLLRLLGNLAAVPLGRDELLRWDKLPSLIDLLTLRPDLFPVRHLLPLFPLLLPSSSFLLGFLSKMSLFPRCGA